MLLLSLLALLAVTFYLAKFSQMPRNIWLLFLAQPLALSAYPVMVFIGGLLATRIAPDPSLATVPLTIVILTTGIFAWPAAFIARKLGRRNATLLGLGILFSGALLCAKAAADSQFYWLLAGSVCFGMSMAFIQQLRFAAIESVTDNIDTAKVLSTLLFAGIFAALIGPEVVLKARHWIVDSPQGYAGSFVAIAILVFCSAVILWFFQNPVISHHNMAEAPRPLGVIVKQPIFVIAVISGAVGYGLMSYIMTATPLSMHQVNGHSLEHTKWVIQSHIAAMYLPSLITPYLTRKLGLKVLMLSGALIYLVVAMIALSGQALMHYWWALVLLGLGWNFLFLTGTALLPHSYNSAESHKVQALNDSLVFFSQGLFSLLAGWLLFKASWAVVIYVSMPLTLVVLVAAIYHFKMTIPIKQETLKAHSSTSRA